MNRLLAVLTLGMMLISCKEEVQMSDCKEFDISFKGKASSSIKMSDIFSDVKYIQLDETVQIGNVSSVRIVEDTIYVLDKKKDQIVKYDIKGNVAMKILRRGRGAGEYLSSDQFDVDERTGNISVLDIASRKVLIYTASGDFVDEFKIEGVPRDFALLDNGDYVFYSPDYNKYESYYGIWQTDSRGRFKKHIMEIPRDFKFTSGIYPKYFHHMGDTVYVKGREDSYLLYHISNDAYSTPYHLNVDIEVPKDASRAEGPILDDYQGQVCLIQHYLENKKLLYVQMYNLKDSITLIYNKESGESYEITKNSQVVADVPFAGYYITTTEDAFVGVVLPEFVINNSELSSRFPDITTESSPIISLSYLK